MRTELREEIAALLENDDLRDLPDEARELARDLMRRVLQDGFGSLAGLSGWAERQRATGSPWINIIPADPGTPGQCAQLVLAIAHRAGKSRARISQSGRPPVGLDMALRLLRDNLIQCGSGPNGLYGRTALLLTDYWDRRRAYESRLDLMAHALVGQLRVACLHWDGRRWRRENL